MLMTYTSPSTQTKYCLVRADSRKISLNLNDPDLKAFGKHNIVLFYDSLNQYPLYAFNNAHDSFDAVTRCPFWCYAPLNDKIGYDLAGIAYPNEIIGSQELDAIVELPYLKEFLKQTKFVQHKDLFSILELLSENIQEEFSAAPSSLLESMEDGFTFICSHMTIFMAACLRRLHVPVRICQGYSNNPTFYCSHQAYTYFYESDEPGFDDMLHCWLEILLDNKIITFDPTPYFTFYQQYLLGKVNAPFADFQAIIKKITLQQYFKHSNLFEIVYPYHMAR